MNYLGFWKKLKKPIFILAPMADVTDYAFRQIIAKYGRPDVFWTEFVSADGLAHVLACKKLLIDLKYGKNEHPIVAQIFGARLENIKKASVLCKKLGFDGIDINMGCPDKSVEKQGAGAALIKNPKLARAIIQAAREGGGGLPISVKTRIGYNRNEIETWIPELLAEDLAALIVHLRTRKEMSNPPAHWELMKRIVAIRDAMKKDTLIIGNGDIIDLEDAKKKCKKTGCDGIMLGRAIFGNPWLFSSTHDASASSNFSSLRTAKPNSSLGKIKRSSGAKNYEQNILRKRVRLRSRSIEVKLKIMVEHTKLFEKTFSGRKNFAIMKKHYKAYVNDFEGAKELRMKLMEAKNAKEVEKIVQIFFKQ